MQQMLMGRIAFGSAVAITSQAAWSPAREPSTVADKVTFAGSDQENRSTVARAQSRATVLT
jgi:hypothetical protein